MPTIESSVVAILDAQNNVKGAGFVAGERLILTCAHVVELAGGAPGGSVIIRFHHGREQRTATVSHWDAHNDLAVLRLTDDLPLGVTRLRLGDAIETTGQSFRAFGYPPDLGTDGSHAEGSIFGKTRLKDSHEVLELKSAQLARGHSGGPVFVNDRVIGVITAVYHTDYTLKNFDTAWGIPIELARALCPDLATPALWPLGQSYADSPNFTGRLEERAALSTWLDAGPPVMVLRALGGFGKSALTWHWLQNDVDSTRWPRTFWWNFYDESAFERFLENALPHFDIDPTKLGARLQADALLEKLTEPGVLLVLDGFERALRAFRGMDAAYQGDETEESAPYAGPDEDSLSQRDCISFVAEEFLRGAASRTLRGRVLITTRFCPRVLEGHDGLPLSHCHLMDLNELSPADAVTFFQAQQIRGMRAEIEAACAPYGYHPLSLRLLAGLIISDLRQPGDIVVAQRLDVIGDLVQRRHHVLEQAYNSLTPTRQSLLSRIACFRGAITYEALPAIVGKGSANKKARRRRKAPPHSRDTDADLRDLIARGLLHSDPNTQRFDLHPIVRRYAYYDRMADEDKIATHIRLRDYFAAIEVPAKPKTLDDLAPVIELYHHTLRAGQYYDAFKVLRDHLIPDPLYFQFGAYQLCIDLQSMLFPNGEDQPPCLKVEGDQAWALNALGGSYSRSGQPRRAVPLVKRASTMVEKQGNKKSLAIGLGNLATEQMAIGALSAAEANLRRKISLCSEIAGKFEEAAGHGELGRLLAYLGEWEQSAAELSTVLEMIDKQRELQAQRMVWNYHAIHELLRSRYSTSAGYAPEERGGIGSKALAAVRHALELADRLQKQVGHPYVRSYVQESWLLGAAHCATGNHAEAEHYLNEALTRCRGINLVEFEADILIDLARLRAATNAPEEAERLAEEALRITERCGYVLQGADAHLELAKLALGRGDKTAALEHARAARSLATCDGPPDYTYKVAYEEAGRLLEELRAAS